MSTRPELNEAIDFLSAEERKLKKNHKWYWLLIPMGIFFIGLHFYSLNEARKFSDYSKEITETVSPESIRDLLVLVDAKINLLKGELRFTHNCFSLFMGAFLIVMGFANITMYKNKLRKIRVIKNVISHIQENS